MDPYGSARAPGQAPSFGAFRRASGEPQQQLNHRASNISDISDFSTFDVYQSAAVLQSEQPRLRGRESLVSVDSLVFDSSINAYTVPPPGTTTTASSAATSPLVPAVTPPTQHVAGGRGTWSVPAAAPSAGPAPYAPYDSSYGSTPPSTPGGQRSGAAVTRRLSSVFSSRRGSRGFDAAHATIPEEGPYDGAYDGSRESIDMTSLVQNAASVGRSSSSLRRPFGRTYQPVSERDLEDAADGDGGGPRPSSRRRGAEHGMAAPPVDLSSYFGPASGQDEAFIRNLQEQEARGQLTGGLGAGFGPGTRLRESELLASASALAAGSPIAPSVNRGASLRRTLSRRWASAGGLSASSPLTPSSASALPFSREGTIRALAQSEANRRGEIVEVIMEEDEDERARGGGGHGNDDDDDGAVHVDSQYGGSGSKDPKVDLSVVSGPEDLEMMAGGSLGKANRQSSIPLRSVPTSGTMKTQVFYPQPNWRPFSMRGPYLVFLILLSLALGVTQELIYRQSLRKPLVVFHEPSEIPPGLYFAFKFAPTLVTVTYGVLWQVTDFEVKRLEAFYQMSREHGAVADESINVDYVTYFAFFRPFRALYCKHYAVAVSSVASLLAVSLVPTLGAAAIVLTPDRRTRLLEPEGEKRVIISAVWSRTLTAVLFAVAALGCLLFWLLQRRRSGLLSDVKGIAGLASMAVVSHIMADFRGMDVATHKDIHSKLKDHRYVLRNSSLAPDDENPVSLAERERYKDFDSHMSQNPHPLMLRAGGCVPFIVSVVLFAVLLPVFLFTPANLITDKAAWLLTALAVSIKLGWGGLEGSVRLMEPYYLLWRRHAPAKTLTLDYTAMPFLWVVLQALKNGHLLVFFVGFGTVMAELLTVLVTSLATAEGRQFLYWGRHGPELQLHDAHGNAGEETMLSFWVTLGLALFILAYMAVVAAAVFLRRRRPFLPRQPNTIASVLAFIHQSKMLYSFVGTSKMNNAKMLAKLEDKGLTYGLGWFEGRDGETHCGVDQEELIKDYEVGNDYTLSNKPWIEQPPEW